MAVGRRLVLAGAGAVLLPAARRSGRPPLGAAIRAEQLRDPTLARLAARCGSLTAEVASKWDALQPTPTSWQSADADAIATFAGAHGARLRGHTLLWDQATPGWAKDAFAGGWDWSIVEGWFAGALRHFRHVAEWDVINEPIDTEAGDDGLRRTAFQRRFGNGYLTRALTEARRHAPRARLMINEYGLEYANPVDAARRAALLRWAARLVSTGTPLGGIGLQAHLDLGKGPLAVADIGNFVRELTALGLVIAVTELDVREADRTLPRARRDALVADEVARFLDAVLAETLPTAITTWGLTDRDSWLGAENRGLPYDAQLKPKPLLAVLRARTA